MPVNILDVQDAILKAKVTQQKLVKESINKFFEPMQKTAMAITLQNIPPEVKQQLTQMAPDAMRNLEQKLTKKG